jgi:hypothetical protein
VVDEPWAKSADFIRFTREVAPEFWNIKNWGRTFQSTLVMNYLTGKNEATAAMLAKVAAGKEPLLEHLIPTQEAIDAAWKKTQGAGDLDPWGLTYSTSALAPFSAFLYPTERLDQQCAATGQASRLVNGRVTAQGWPHVKSFANAFNMHVGTYLLGLWGSRKTGNADLAHWVLDATQNPSIQGVYGHGQRPYTMNAGDGDPSDALYQFVCDFWLRAIELTCNEDLSLHPSIYGKYFDSIDVNSDRYQRSLEEKPEKVGAWWRATFLRTQSHDHRWEAWSAGPYIGMLANASDSGAVGITEACYYMQRFVGKPVGYNELAVVFLPEVLLGKAVQQYRPAPRPALPANVQVKPAAGKNVITWDAVKGETAGYRIYRTESVGGLWTWINSPWTKTAAFVPPTEAQRPKPAKRGDPSPPPAQGVKPYEMKIPQVPDTLVKGTSFTDPDGKPESVYFVTAQDKDGRESRWFPNEPLPAPGRK